MATSFCCAVARPLRPSKQNSSKGKPAYGRERSGDYPATRERLKGQPQERSLNAGTGRFSTITHELMKRIEAHPHGAVAGEVASTGDDDFIRETTMIDFAAADILTFLSRSLRLPNHSGKQRVAGSRTPRRKPFAAYCPPCTR
jgi:hypothetical protein